MMKSPYRKGLQITISNAAIIAAAGMIATVYRGVNETSSRRVVDLASLIVDEIEARLTEPVSDVQIGLGEK